MDTQILVSMRGVSEQAFGSRCADGLYRDFVTHAAATRARTVLNREKQKKNCLPKESLYNRRI